MRSVSIVRNKGLYPEQMMGVFSSKRDAKLYAEYIGERCEVIEVPYFESTAVSFFGDDRDDK